MMAGLPVFLAFSFPPPRVAVCCVVDLNCVCVSSADLAGPPHRPPRGFLRGSSAGLSRPPRRGPRGSLPRGRLFVHSSRSRHRGVRIATTGWPLLGSTLGLQSRGLFHGASCCRAHDDLWNGGLGGILSNQRGSLRRHLRCRWGCHPASHRPSRRFKTPRSRTRAPATSLLSENNIRFKTLLKHKVFFTALGRSLIQNKPKDNQLQNKSLKFITINNLCDEKSIP